MKHTGVCGVVCAILLCMQVAAARTEYTDAAANGFHFVEAGIDARHAAMGHAATVVAPRGFDMYNPALTGMHASTYVTAHMALYAPGDLRNAALEAGGALGPWHMASSVRSYTIDDITETAADGSFTGGSSSQQQTVMTVGVARRRNAVTFGVNLHGVQDRIGSETAHAASVSIGAAYELVPGRLWLGAAGFHLNDYFEASRLSTRFFDDGEVARLPVYGRAGLAYTDTLWHTVATIALDGVYRKTDERIMVPAGIELSPQRVPWVSFRMGTRFNHDTELLSLGTGVRFNALEGSLCCIIPRLVHDTQQRWQLSCTYSLGE